MKSGGAGLLRGLPPLVGPRARALVLGSFPSAASLAASCYYAHPRNHFWPILALAWKEAFPEPLAERGAWALDRGLAVWDSLGACIRPGSLDGDISRAEPNGVAALLGAWPGIGRVLLNGSASARYFMEAMEGAGAEMTLRDAKSRGGSLELPGGRRVDLFFLPSTSPVPSREFRRLEDKLPLWLKALEGIKA